MTRCNPLVAPDEDIVTLSWSRTFQRSADTDGPRAPREAVPGEPCGGTRPSRLRCARRGPRHLFLNRILAAHLPSPASRRRSHRIGAVLIATSVAQPDAHLDAVSPLREMTRLH